MTAACLPRYPIYVPSKGRWQPDRALTVKALHRDEVPLRLVVEPQEADQYARLIEDRDQLLVLPFSNLGQGSIPARNWIRDHAEAEGHARHYQLDDNLIEFRRLWKGRRIPCDAGVALRVCEDLSDRYENVGVSGLNYQMFVPAETSVPFYRNCHVYSCVAPETPILCTDLSWRPAGELMVGQEIVAFDEEPVVDDGRIARCYRTAIVDRNDAAVKNSYRVTTDIGIPIIASDEHPWLAFRYATRQRRWKDRPADTEGTQQQRLRWVRTSDLRVGDRIAHLSRPWVRDATHDGGWISGMFDGEGTMMIRTRASGTRSVSIGIAQKQGLVLDRLRKALLARGYDAWLGNGNTDRSDGTYLRGGFPEMLRFAGEFRPTRIEERFSEMWEGRKLWRGGTYELAVVTAIEPAGDCQVSSISTSSGTFITGGYLTHNCSLVNHEMPCRWRGHYNEDTDLCLQALDSGWCTILVNAFMANKLRTMAMGGGNTDVLYAGDGRLKMARVLAEAWPGTVSVRWRFGRPQHVVRWDRFETPLRPRPGVADLPPDEYGLALRAVGEVRSPALREMLAESS